jgi:hypothetical protein
MEVRIEDGLKILTPAQGKYLTDGNLYTQTEVYMKPSADISMWTEVDNAPEPEQPDEDISDTEALHIITGQGNETE